MAEKVIEKESNQMQVHNEDAFTKFTELIKDQFQYGGKKYSDKTDSTKEVTDILFDVYGDGWLFGTIDKYTYRFENVHREKDLLKIACYMYILWLKRGFFVHPTGVNDPPLFTTVKIKERYFDDFISNIKNYKVPAINKTICILGFDTMPGIDKISCLVKSFASSAWESIKQDTILEIFIYTLNIWEEEFYNKHLAGKDTDTNLEKN